MMPESEETALENRSSIRIIYAGSRLYGKVLDCGCNLGFLIDHLTDAVKEYEGIDMDGNLITEAIDNYGPQPGEPYPYSFEIGFRIHDVSRPLPYPDERFDSCFTGEVLEHLSDPLPTLREIHRVLKRGGLLIVTTPLQWEGFNPDHKHEYGVQELKGLLSEAGLNVESVQVVSQNPERWWRLLMVVEARKVRGVRSGGVVRTEA